MRVCKPAHCSQSTTKAISFALTDFIPYGRLKIENDFEVKPALTCVSWTTRSRSSKTRCCTDCSSAADESLVACIGKRQEKV